MSVEYHGEKFAGYNKPKRTPSGKKKSAVLAKKGSKVKLVRFGDPSLSIKKDQPARKKSYCARSAGQGNTGTCSNICPPDRSSASRKIPKEIFKRGSTGL